MKNFLTPLGRVSAVFGLVLLSVAGCKKEEPANPLLDCRPPSGGSGVGTPNPRTIMFWTSQDFACGTLSLVSIRNTETNGAGYGSSYNTNTIYKYFATQPTCGTAGTMNIRVSQGYEYEYTIACTGRQWKGKVTVDCTSTDCIPILLK